MEASRATSASLEIGGVRQLVADYVTLTKPRVQLLLLLPVLIAVAAAVRIEGGPLILSKRSVRRNGREQRRERANEGVPKTDGAAVVAHFLAFDDALLRLGFD